MDEQNFEQNAALAESLTRELETLREEKRRRALLEAAQAGLQARGLPTGFAPFVMGEDEKTTAKNVGVFERQFTTALAGEMARRLPQDAPADFNAAPPAKRVRRGIRKV
jgi:hypothetical protein